MARLPATQQKIDKAHELRTQGLSVNAIARELDVSPTTVSGYLEDPEGNHRTGGRTPWKDIQPIERLVDPVWSRQPGETAKAFRAWQTYRDLDLYERSIKKAAAALGRRNTSVLEDWARRFRWQDRRAAWDLHVEDLAVRAQEHAVIEMNERHAHIAVETLKKVLQRVTGDDAEGVTAIDASKLSAQDLARLLEVGVKIENLARGTSTERVDNQNRPVEIRLAFDAEPRYRPGFDVEVSALPADDEPRELPPAA